MLTIPLYTALIIYFVFLFIFLIFFLTNVRHIMLTGTNTFMSFAVTFIVLILTALTVWGTWNFVRSADWQRPLIVWDSGWLGSSNNGY